MKNTNILVTPPDTGFRLFILLYTFYEVGVDYFCDGRRVEPPPPPMA